MPVATATLSDSTSRRWGVQTSCVDARRARRRQPAPFVADGDREPAGRATVATRRARARRRPRAARARSRRNGRSSSQVRMKSGVMEMAPIALRTTFAFHRSTVPGRATVAVTPSAAAVRIDGSDVARILHRVEDEQRAGLASAP